MVAEIAREEESKELPEGLFKPGYMTTTADPEMRRRAQRTIEKHRKRRSDARSDDD